MPYKLALTAFLSFFAGFAAHFLLLRILQVPQSTADHWRVVNAYRAHVMNPKNYTYDPQSGLSTTEPPPNPHPSLFALVNAGELRHLDIVLPTVPSTKESDLLWIKVAENHESILHAEGHNGTGEPLHLNLWFKPQAQADVDRLIEELKAYSSAESERSDLKSRPQVGN